MFFAELQPVKDVAGLDRTNVVLVFTNGKLVVEVVRTVALLVTMAGAVKTRGDVGRGDTVRRVVVRELVVRGVVGSRARVDISG